MPKFPIYLFRKENLRDFKVIKKKISKTVIKKCVILSIGEAT